MSELYIPKNAEINLKIDLNLHDWLTEDDKESIIEISKDQEDIDDGIIIAIQDYLDTIINYKTIDIKLYD